MVAALLRDSSCHRILDAGCGYGRIGVPLAEAGFDVVGVVRHAWYRWEVRWIRNALGADG